MCFFSLFIAKSDTIFLLSSNMKNCGNKTVFGSINFDSVSGELYLFLTVLLQGCPRLSGPYHILTGTQRQETTGDRNMRTVTGTREGRVLLHVFPPTHLTFNLSSSCRIQYLYLCIIYLHIVL